MTIEKSVLRVEYRSTNTIDMTTKKIVVKLLRAYGGCLGTKRR